MWKIQFWPSPSRPSWQRSQTASDVCVKDVKVIIAPIFGKFPLFCHCHLKTIFAILSDYCVSDARIISLCLMHLNFSAEIPLFAVEREIGVMKCVRMWSHSNTVESVYMKGRLGREQRGIEGGEGERREVIAPPPQCTH